MTRWYEDIGIGEVFELGSHTFELDEIIRFGRLYDPQYFHVDKDLAELSQFGGPIASGWHTVCVGHRIMVDALSAEASRLRDLGELPGEPGPSPGVNKMDFKAPVRPGDTVHYQLTVTSKRHSKSLPGWGLLINLIEATNQKGELVYRAELASFSKRRDYKPTLRQRVLGKLATSPGLGRLVRAMR